MVVSKLSDCFKVNFLFLKILGIWPGKNSSRCYNIYCVLFLCIFVFIYDISLVLNFISTPPEIELMIRELIFLFTEVTVMGKVFLVLLMRKKLFAAFDVLDCEAFKGIDEVSKKIVERHFSRYKNSWKIYAILGMISYFSLVFMPIFMHFIFKTHLELPVCKYYFLDDGVVRRFFAFWFIYQSIGLYIHLQYNTNIDTLMSGLLYMAIAQVKVLKHEMNSLRILKIKKSSFSNDDALQINALNKCLKHYEVLLNYCSLVQDIIGVALFIQFSMGSIMICITLCRLLLPVTIETVMFLVTYLGAIVLEIFIPSWLGTQLSYESGQLVSAAYSSEWIPRSERFKRSLKLFMVRANTNIVITGGQIFPLSLDTFTSIAKTAYSFFTLVRNVQDQQNI